MEPLIGEILLSVFLVLAFFWIRNRRNKLKLFELFKIPGPSPHFLFGNMQELSNKGRLQCYTEWIEKYGKIVGFWMGMKPVLLVADPDLLKKIFITDFNIFSDRPESIPLRVHSLIDHILPASDIMDNVLPNLKSEKWKIVRRILSPTFSANKLKMMIPAVNEVTDIALSVLSEQSRDGQDVNIYETLERLTLDLICAQAFAMDVNSLGQREEDELLRSARVIFDVPYNSYLFFVGQCFPELGVLTMTINFLRMFIQNRGYIPPLKITKVLDKILQQRRRDPAFQRPDLLQSLMDATLSTEKVDKNIFIQTTSSADHPKNKLTDLEVKANALVVFLAGYETTSSSLAYAFYFLAQYPELQARLQKEIDQILTVNDSLDYYNVKSLNFVENFMMETMRFKPPAVNFISRVSSADVDYGYVFIPKGIQIDVPVHYIHHSGKFFEEPNHFNPERFSVGSRISPVSYWAFGVGPRSCIGTRIVNLTTKIVLAKVLHKYDVLPPLQKYEMVSKDNVATTPPVKVLVRLRERQKNND